MTVTAAFDPADGAFVADPYPAYAALLAAGRVLDDQRAVVDRLVDRIAAAGGGDLVADLAEPLSVTVIADLLGVPVADRPLLRPWSARICGLRGLQALRVAS